MQDKTTILQKVKKTSLVATIILLSASALLGIILVLVGASLTQLRIVGTTLILGIFSSLIVDNVTRIDRKRKLLRVLAGIALTTSLIATILLILGVWGLFEIHCANDDHYCYANGQLIMELISKIIWICIFLAFTATIDGRFASYDNTSGLTRISQVVTISCATILGLLFATSVLTESFPGDFWRIIVIMGILLVLGLIITPILVTIDKHRNQQAINSSIKTNEQKLRAKIEQEVRAQIAAEEKAKKSASQTPET